MKSLDLYNQAEAEGIISEYSVEEMASLEALKSQYEADIEYLNGKIRNSNKKIAAWRTQKTTADKNYKKTLSTYISAEQGKITSVRSKIAEIKTSLSKVKSRISEISKFKSASHYITQGVKESRNYYDDLLSSEKNNYEIWYNQNKDSASFGEIAQRKSDNIKNRTQLQQTFVDEIAKAYKKMSEIYGENSAESVNLQEILKDEVLVLENLKNSYEDIGKAVKDALEDKKEDYELEKENAKLLNELWNLTEGHDAYDHQKREQNIKSLNLQLKEQGNIVVETANAYGEMIRQYGVSSDESKKLENQLLSECVAYEKLAEKIRELYSVEEYSRKEREDIVFGLNDFLKNNKEFLLSTGMTEEEIYALAKQVTGYDELWDYTLNSPKSGDVTSSDELTEDIFRSLLEEHFGAVPESFFDSGVNVESFKNAFLEVDGIIELLGGIVDFAGELLYLKESYGRGGDTYSSVYNFTASADETIADQIYAVRKYDSIKKARGLG